MSYESMVDHMQRELVAGATRRRRRERIHRGVAAVVVAAAVVIGAVALTGDDDEASRISTEPTPPTAEARAAARTEACYAYLDLTAFAALPGPSTTAALEQIAALATTSGDEALARITATIRDKYPKSSGDTTSEETARELGAAYRGLIDRCREIGLPGLNPVYVSPPRGPAPRVDLSAYGTEQPLEPATTLPTNATPAQGRDLSPVALAATPQGAYVMTYSYQSAGAPTPTFCRRFGSAHGGSGICGAIDDPKTIPLSDLIRAAFGEFLDATPIEVSDSVSFVVFEAPGQRLVQRPAAGIAMFVWQPNAPATRKDFTARAYAADGVQLGCVASGTSVC
jgi:hypothetical protein